MNRATRSRVLMFLQQPLHYYFHNFMPYQNTMAFLTKNSNRDTFSEWKHLLAKLRNMEISVVKKLIAAARKIKPGLPSSKTGTPDALSSKGATGKLNEPQFGSYFEYLANFCATASTNTDLRFMGLPSELHLQNLRGLRASIISLSWTYLQIIPTQYTGDFTKYPSQPYLLASGDAGW